VSRSRTEQEDRAAGSLWGLALGDALGMPTQLMSRPQVVEWYGRIDWFVAAGADHPIAAGLAAGTVTDDTEQALLLAAALVDGAHLDQASWVASLQAWERSARARGSLDLLGPSTRAALAALEAGLPPEAAGRNGTTNGAAMRIAPVGIAVDSADQARLVDRVIEASLATHQTSVAVAGAAAVAAAVSRCIDGAALPEALSFAVQAAEAAARQGRWVAGASVARRIEWAVSSVGELPESRVADFVVDLVGTSLAPQESVPAACALAAAFGSDPWRAVCAAAGLGGDSDTIAAITGAIVGARSGRGGFPDRAIQQVRQTNRLEIDPVARRLLDIRWG